MKGIGAGMSMALATIGLLATSVVPASADDPCEDFTKQLQSFKSVLTSTVKGKVGSGRFEVKPIRRDGRLLHWSISYRLSRGPVFRRNVPAPAPGEADLEISVHKFGGYSSLVFRYLLGAGGAIGCAYAVFPRAGRFAVLQIGGAVRDLDGDGNHEIIVQEQEPWGWDCGLSRAALPHWPKVLRLDPKSGKMTDVSRRFPQIYAARLKDYQEIYQQQKEYLSPECRARFNDFLARLKRFAG